MNPTLKKILIGVGALAVIAWFVIANVFMTKYTGTFHMKDGGNWTKVTAEIEEGDADKFTAEMKDGQTLKVSYDGKFELRAVLTFTDGNGKTARYSLWVYQAHAAGEDGLETRTSFERID